ncbi:MAG: energy-coupled thiamine transporter ThiT [Oscillospiraceae bacterium]|nr:energy-coupled thiamine transporter ThiT [Oscillospiraceae bacterium]
MEIKKKTRMLTECAVMLSIATVLSFIKIFESPFGGSVTLGSMVPLVVLSVHIKEFKWASLACFAYALIQMLFGFYAPPAANVIRFIAVVMLDYVVAFGVICLANPVSKMFENKIIGVSAGAFIACVLRFFCHFTTGILIWDSYAPEGTPVWMYSLIYNGGYMLPELVITVVLSAVLYTVIEKKSKA